jgi:hypothetical protein
MKLTLAQVRAAGLPASLMLGQLTYEYRPALDSVAVFVGASRRPTLSIGHRIPLTGWLHEAGCACLLCSQAREAPAA